MTEQESDIDALVKKWVNENYGAFKEGGKPNGSCLYRKSIFERCKRYRDAPEGYLKTMLEKSLPDSIKWYFNIYQIVFVAGTVSVSTTLFFWFLNNLFVFLTDRSTVSFVKMVIPVAFLIAIVALIWHEKSGSPWLSRYFQIKFKIVHNLKEIYIEMYYIAKVLEMREKSKGKQS